MKYPWWERWGDLRLRRYDGPISDLAETLDVAAWFIEHHAENAEPHGWRPVHVLRPHVGLAHRWRLLPVPFVAVTERALFARWHPRTSGLSFAYRPNLKGHVEMLTGPEREEALSHV